MLSASAWEKAEEVNIIKVTKSEYFIIKPEMPFWFAIEVKKIAASKFIKLFFIKAFCQAD